MIRVFLLTCALTIVSFEGIESFTSCVQKQFSGSSFVCVCNATYCDTVEPETPLPANKFAVYTTSKKIARMRKMVHPVPSSGKSQQTQIVVTIEPLVRRQFMTGFGGTFTDAAGMSVASLPQETQDKFIESYYGAPGIEYSLGRIPIASNDMSTEEYSYDFTADDMELNKFTISEYDHKYKIPYIDKAVVASPHDVALYGSPWAPPGWMKTNGDMTGYGTIRPDMMQVYANYLVRFIREYEGFMLHGRMNGLTTQSGPTRSCDKNAKPQYQSVCWTSETMKNFISEYLKPALLAQGYAHIELLTMDDNRDELANWSDTFFQDAIASKDIGGFAVQSYHDETTLPDILCKTLNRFHPSKIVLASEFSIRDDPVIDLGSWERGVRLARRVFQDLQNCVTGFTDYNLAVNMNGGVSWVNNFADSPIVVDTEQQVFYKQPMFYIMGQFSKFVHPGCLVITSLSTGSNTDNPVVSFLRDDGAYIIIVGNFVSKVTDIEIRVNILPDPVVKYTMGADSINTFIVYKLS